MTGDLCNLVFGQIIHWIISVLLSKIKTEVLVLGEKKLGVKRNSRVSKEVGLLGAWGFFCFVFPPLDSFLCYALLSSLIHGYIGTSEGQQAVVPVQVQGGDGDTHQQGLFCHRRKPVVQLPPVCLFCESSVCFLRCLGSHAPSHAGFVYAVLS